MNLYVIESKMKDVTGAHWHPWDGAGYKSNAAAENALAKLQRKKTAVVDWEYRITPYAPTASEKA